MVEANKQEAKRKQISEYRGDSYTIELRNQKIYDEIILRDEIIKETEETEKANDNINKHNREIKYSNNITNKKIKEYQIELYEIEIYLKKA